MPFSHLHLHYFHNTYPLLSEAGLSCLRRVYHISEGITVSTDPDLLLIDPTGFESFKAFASTQDWNGPRLWMEQPHTSVWHTTDYDAACPRPFIFYRFHQTAMSLLEQQPERIVLDRYGHVSLLRNTIIFREQNHYNRIQLRDLVAVEADGHYCDFIGLDGSKKTFRIGIRKLEPLLTDRGFATSHRSCLINLSYLEDSRLAGSSLMVNGRSYPLSRRRKKELKKFLL